MNKNLKKLLTVSLLTVCVATFLSGCGNSQKTTIEDKVITFAAETTYPPFEYADGNEYKGFDVDLSKAIAKEMGYESKFVSMGFDALIPALQSRQIDAIASGLVITEKRKEQVLFTDVYYVTKLCMVVKGDDAAKYKDEKDLAHKTVAAQIGTTGAFLAEKQEGTTVKQFDSISNMLQDLQNGSIQVAMLDEPVANYYIQKSGMKGLKVIPVPTQDAHDIAIAVNKDNKKLLDDMNAALKRLKENGEYDKLVKKWLGDAK